MSYFITVWERMADVFQENSALKSNPRRNLLLSIQKWKQQNNIWNLFKVTNKETRAMSLQKQLTDVLSKKLFLKILQNSQENTCARVSFLIKLPASGLQLYSKSDFGTGICLPVNFAKFLRKPFWQNTTGRLFM